MELEEFMNLLSKAKKDRFGNMYIEEKEFDPDPMFNELGKERWYFTLTNTVCADFVKEYCYKEKDGYEHYNRHYIDDDTLQIKVVRKKEERINKC